jgi:hypothetical protein
MPLHLKVFITYNIHIAVSILVSIICLLHLSLLKCQMQFFISRLFRILYWMKKIKILLLIFKTMDYCLIIYFWIFSRYMQVWMTMLLFRIFQIAFIVLNKMIDIILIKVKRKNWSLNIIWHTKELSKIFKLNFLAIFFQILHHYL